MIEMMLKESPEHVTVVYGDHVLIHVVSVTLSENDNVTPVLLQG